MAKSSTPARRNSRKKKEQVADNPFEMQDAALAAMSSKLAEKLGDERIMTQEQSEQRVIGIPVPSLAVAYLLQNDIVPFGKMYTFNGEQSGGKSSLMNEFARWVCEYGGLVQLIENETKDFPDLRAGLFHHNPALLHRVQIAQTESIEEWQRVMTISLDQLTKVYEKNGRCFPAMIGLDSVAGKTSESENKKIDEEGHTKRDFSQVAWHVARYMQSMPRKLINMPMIVVGIQHLKKDKAPGTYGAVTRNTNGGRALKFYESFEVEVERTKAIELVDEGGQRVRLTTRKAMGQFPKKVEVTYRWWWDTNPHTGEWCQYFVWDWYEASIDLLVGFSKDQKTLWQRINEVVDLHPIKSRRKIWSNRLGIPESDPVSYHDAGIMLEHHHLDVLCELYKLLTVKRRRRFRINEDMMAICGEPVPQGLPAITNYGDPARRLMSSEVEQLLIEQKFDSDEDGAESAGEDQEGAGE